jgi:hypothetical protein
MSAPCSANALLSWRQATPNPPLLCGGSSQPSINTLIVLSNPFVFTFKARFCVV